jgi:hypothetical protein
MTVSHAKDLDPQGHVLLAELLRVRAMTSVSLGQVALERCGMPLRQHKLLALHPEYERGASVSWSNAAKEVSPVALDDLGAFHRGARPSVSMFDRSMAIELDRLVHTGAPRGFSTVVSAVARWSA